MANPIPELPMGVKWSMEFDPTTGGYFPRFTVSAPDGATAFSDGMLMTIDQAHREVHEGNTYLSTLYTGTVANNDFIGIMISLTGTLKNAHSTFEFAAGGDAEIRFYENVTGSNYGTKITSHNINHASSNVAQVQIFKHATITVLNEIVFNLLLPGGSGGAAGGGTFRRGTEHILEHGKRYYLQAFNRAGQAKPMSVGVQWYEEEIG